MLTIRWYLYPDPHPHTRVHNKFHTAAAIPRFSRVFRPLTEFPILQTLVLWPHSNSSPESPAMSNSERSLSEEQTQERPRFCKEFAIPPRVQRSIGLVHGESPSGYVLILSRAFDLII